jgi:general stress protein 26
VVFEKTQILQPMNQENQGSLKELLEKIKDVHTAMLVTCEEDGTMRSRPMNNQKADESGYLWFFTGYGSHKAEEIKHDSHVNLSYADPGKNLYVSVSGTAQVSRDKQKIDELWDPSLKAWFPEGKEDPNVALLRVKVTKGEFWDTHSNTMVHLFGLAKALVTGETYQPGENKKVSAT